MIKEINSKWELIIVEMLKQQKCNKELREPEPTELELSNGVLVVWHKIKPHQISDTYE